MNFHFFFENKKKKLTSTLRCNQMPTNRKRSSRLSKDCHTRQINVEKFGVFVHPLHGSALIKQTPIATSARLCRKLCKRSKASNTKTLYFFFMFVRMLIEYQIEFLVFLFSKKKEIKDFSR